MKKIGKKINKSKLTLEAYSLSNCICNCWPCQCDDFHGSDYYQNLVVTPTFNSNKAKYEWTRLV